MCNSHRAQLATGEGEHAMSEADGPAGPRSGIKADLSAKAELSARAELKGEIPPDVIRKGSNVLWDLLSPLTERAGLRGDQLRLQRQDVLVEIAKRARELAAIEQIPLNPLPNKLMVPLLEKASLEDLEGEMLDRWARLMLSAAQEYDAVLLTYVDILSRFGQREARLLRDLCSKGVDTVIKVGEAQNAIIQNEADHHFERAFEYTLYNTILDKKWESNIKDILERCNS
jgi:hypothetical protein